jgi:hypothetical protein
MSDEFDIDATFRFRPPDPIDKQNSKLRIIPTINNAPNVIQTIERISSFCVGHDISDAG